MGMGGCFPGGIAAGSVKLTIHLQLVPRSRIRGSIHPLLHTASWRSVYLVKTQVQLYLTLPLPRYVMFSILPSLPPVRSEYAPQRTQSHPYRATGSDEKFCWKRWRQRAVYSSTLRRLSNLRKRNSFPRDICGNVPTSSRRPPSLYVF
jgi:hypothetical protein